ncbi:putative linoleate 9S-lipoxygenase [Rosa chinensis]|uniref:Putative linoleate 9S-lipoxygenase n=1 Tax=Rosa chinensis TaxID=74649 RepID=A0A2P6R6Z4_ROSCH|nr:putative linoleate 9S-lipoxygenase [Rosa chinensis]
MLNLVSFLIYFNFHKRVARESWKGSILGKLVRTVTPITARESVFNVTFDWEEEIRVPGAFLIRNNHHSEFYLKTVTLEDVPDEGRIHCLQLLDSNSESRLNLLLSLNIYVPRDERFGHLKLADFLTYGLKSIAQFVRTGLEALSDDTPNEFDSFEDVLKLYEGGIPLPQGLLKDIGDNIPVEMLKEILRTDGGENFLRFPVPQVIKEDMTARRTNEEFA